MPHCHDNEESVPMTTAEDETPPSDDGKQPTTIHRHPWRLPIFVILGFALTACVAVRGTPKTITSIPAVSTLVPAASSQLGFPEDRKLAPLRDSGDCFGDCLPSKCEPVVENYGGRCDGYFTYTSDYHPSHCVMDTLRYYNGCYNCTGGDLDLDMIGYIDRGGTLSVDLLVEVCFFLRDPWLYPYYATNYPHYIEPCIDVESSEFLQDLATYCEIPARGALEDWNDGSEDDGGSEGSDCLPDWCQHSLEFYGRHCDDDSDTNYIEPSVCMIYLLKYYNGCYNCHVPPCFVPEDLMDIVDSSNALTVDLLVEGCFLRQDDYERSTCIDGEHSVLKSVADWCELPTRAEIESSENGGSNDGSEDDGGSEGGWDWGSGGGLPRPVVPPGFPPPGGGLPRPVVPIGPLPAGSSF